MQLYANLHMHSTHSDGVFSPEELVDVAKREGYRALAVTDHDTYSGFAPLQVACQKAEMTCLLGTEFSCPAHKLGHHFHIVGFSFDPTYPAMHRYLQGLSESETHQTEVLFRRGIAEELINGITWEEVLAYNTGITWLCDEHVFRAMKAKGLVTDTDYYPFFQHVYGPRRAEVPPTHAFLPPDELFRLIHAAGGIAILAHPHNQLPCVRELVEMGLDGIEVWHADLKTLQERMDALRLAEQYGLYVSGGSDHSGLCGGQYVRYEHPEEGEHWIPPLSTGTTEIFYQEIIAQKRETDRSAYIHDILRANDMLI